MSMQEARERARLLAGALADRLREVQAIDDQGWRADVWSSLGEDYFQLSTIVVEYGREALEGIEGVPSPSDRCVPYGVLAMALAEAERAGACGRSRVATFPQLEANADGRRMLDDVTAGRVTGTDIAEVEGRLVEVVHELMAQGLVA